MKFLSNMKDIIQENKDLLLKDLCARLPYNVKLSYKCNHTHILTGVTTSGLIVINDIITNITMTTDVENIKPYLFPFESMTEEQEKEYLNTCNGYCTYYWTNETFDWLNENHFDYRGLISMELANDATGLNIY